MGLISGAPHRAASTKWAAVMIAAFVAAAGCDVDSFMDPSNIGRWENTPVVLPILERLDVIDEPVQEISGLSEVTADDLIPEVVTYVIGPGDLLTVTVFGLITRDVDAVLSRRVDELGYIDLPLLNVVRASGRTARELEEDIAERLRGDILEDPIVTVVVSEARQRTFTIFGTPNAGPYTILKSNFRLLDAVALGGGLPPDVKTIYVVRQVALTPEAEGSPPPEAQRREVPRPRPQTPEGRDPAALLEELAQPPAEAAAAPAQPAPRPPPTPLSEAVDAQGPPADGGRYINVEGRWVLVQDSPQAAGAARSRPSARPGGSGSDAPLPQELVTQRVIEVDAQALMRGEARYNIVVRPNDVVNVPEPMSGYVFLGGAISRPGTYAIAGERRLTLTQAIIAAGGLDPVAIPERLDLYRRIGRDQQAIVRLNLRAIKEGVQPDIFLKPDDSIEIGTNIYAGFLAVIRNSFRTSYGFGFLLDRNFGNDVFGPPPESFRVR